MARKKDVVSVQVGTSKIVLRYPMRDRRLLTWYENQILDKVEACGGFYNGHAHIDRAHTLEDVFLSHIETTPLEASSKPLAIKQDLVGDLHKKEGPAYSREKMTLRMSLAIERQIALGVTRLDTNIDATPDLPEDGLLAINIANELKRKYAPLIKIRIGPTPIFGFKVDARDKRPRWDVYKEAAAMCDFLSLLPEKDDYPSAAARDGKVGFKRHIRMGVELAHELGKEVQFHLDQMNHPDERGTERFLEMLEGLDQPKMAGGEPACWVIHFISPSAYGESQFRRDVDKLLELNVGIVPAPSAGLSMRQPRSVLAPSHTSIARIPELIKMRVPIRLGTDNIEDVFVPYADGDMLTEIKMAACALRVSPPSIWAKLGAGVRLNNVDIDRIGQILYEERKACRAWNPGWEPGIE